MLRQIIHPLGASESTLSQKSTPHSFQRRHRNLSLAHVFAAVSILGRGTGTIMTRQDRRKGRATKLLEAKEKHPGKASGVKPSGPRRRKAPNQRISLITKNKAMMRPNAKPVTAPAPTPRQRNFRSVFVILASPMTALPWCNLHCFLHCCRQVSANDTNRNWG